MQFYESIEAARQLTADIDTLLTETDDVPEIDSIRRETRREPHFEVVLSHAHCPWMTDEAQRGIDILWEIAPFSEELQDALRSARLKMNILFSRARLILQWKLTSPEDDDDDGLSVAPTKPKGPSGITLSTEALVA